MSRTIDERVVEMRFDNKHFESNVATSMSTLEKLKRSLKLDGATKGLEEIDKAAKRVDMTGLGGAVETVRAKFSALDVVAVTALANIANSAVNAGKRLVSSLTIDQVASGWNKFEQKTSSVQTIMNSTGKSIEEVNGYLDKLMWYSDETSYGFTDMTSSLAQLTSAGGDINKLIPMIEGIANSVAFAGKGAAEFSRAIYNLNQSYSMGALQYMDWKSLELAGAGSKQLKQMFIDTAKALGKLSEAGKTANGTLVTTANFTQTLSDRWADTEVMEQAFGRFAVVTEAAYDIVQDSSNKIDTATVAYKVLSGELDETSKEYLSMSEAHKALVGTFSEVEIAAAKSAQEAKTFTEAIDATKDAVSSGWMRSVENMFGNYEQAKKLWSDVCEQLWDIFAAGGERRNDILYETMSSSWDKLSDAVKDTGISAEAFNEAVIATAKDHGIKIDELIKKYGSLGDVISSGKLSKDIVFEAVAGLTPTFKSVTGLLDLATDKLEHFQDVVNKVINGDFGNGEELTKALTDAGENVVAIQTLVNGIWDETNGTWSDTTITAADLAFVLGEMSEEELKNIGYTEEQAASLKKLAKQSEDSWESMNKLIEDLYKPSGRELLFSTIHSTLASISNIIWSFRDGWAEVFPEERVTNGIYNALTKIEAASKRMFEYVDENYDKFVRTFKGLASVLDILASIVGGALKAAFEILNEIFGNTDSTILDSAASAGDLLVAFRNLIKQSGIIEKGFNKIVKAAKKVIDTVKKWIKAFEEIPAVSGILSEIKSIFTTITNSSEDLEGSAKAVSDWLDSFKGVEKLSSAFEFIGNTIEKFITSVGKWFEIFKETEGVKQFTEAISNLVDAIGKLFSGDIDANEFAKVLGDSLANVLVSIPKMAIQFGKDFVAGFANGLGEGFSELIGDVLEFCTNFCSAFAGALGIHSPSTISYQNAVDWCQGFINGLQAMLEPVIAALQPIIDAVKMVFSSFWKYITDENGDLKWDKIITGGITIESLIILKQFADSFEKIANSFTSFSSIFSNVGKALKSFSKVLDGISWDFKAQALLKLAISIGILVAAIWVLTQIDDIGKLWNAVGVIVVLAVIIAGLAWAMNLLSSASLKWDKGPQFEGVKSGLLQIGIALLLVAAVVKIIGKMDSDQAKQGFKGLAGLAVGMIAFLAIMGGISRYSKDVSGIGGMMLKLSFALMLMVAACKLIGLLTLEDIGKGILFVGAFTFFIMALTAVSSVANSEISKIGSMAIKLSFAMALLAGVCKLVGMLSPDEMFKGAIFAAAFVGFVWALVAVTKMGYQEHVESVGALVLGVSLSLLAMVGVCKIAGKLTWKEIAKGIVAVGAMTGLIIAMVAILKVGDAQDLTKVGGTIIAMSTAIMIMAGTAVILGMVPTKDLAKGIAAVSVLGIIMALMVHGLKGAAAVKGEIIAMTACLILVAGCIVILTRVADKDKLESASAAMIAVMAALSFMVRSLKGLEKGKISTGSVYALMGVVLILAGIIALLSYAIKDPMSAVGAATSLGVLLMALSTSLVIMSKAGRISKTVTDQLASMIGVIMGLALILGMLAQFPNADVMIPNAIALGILVNAMASSMFVMGKAGRISKTVSDQFASMIGIIMGMALILGMLAQFPNAEVMIPNAIALGVLMNAMASALFIMGKAGRISKTVTDQLMTMTLVIGGLGIILGILSLFPNAEVMIPNAIALGILVNALAAAMVILGFAGPNAAKAVPAAMTMGLVLGEIALALAVLGLLDVAPSLETALALSTLLLALSAACAIVSFIPSAAAIDGALGLAAFIGIMAGVVAIAGGLSKIPGFNELLADGGNTLALVGSAIGQFIGSIVGGIAIGVASSLPVIGVALSEFMVGAEPFIKMASTVGSEVIQGAGYIAGAILALSSAGFISGLMSLMSLGQASLPVIGLQLMIFGKCAKEFGDSISGIDASSVEAATSISNMLLALTASEFLSTITEWFGGSVDFSSLGANLKAFGDAVVEFSNQISGKIDSSAVEAAASAGMLLVELNKALPRSGGLLQDFIGEKDFKAFAEACNSFVKCIIDINTVVGEEDFTMHEETIEKIVKAGTQFSKLYNSLPKSGGKLQEFLGNEDLKSFGSAVEGFAACMIRVNEAVSQEGFEVNLDAIEDLRLAGEKMKDLQSTLPKDGGWWQDVAGSSDIGEFGEKIGKFASVIVDFSNSSSGLNNEGISLAIDTAERIRDLIISLSDFDMSGLPKFIGAGSDGAVQKVAKAITEYSNEVAGINTEAVSVSVSAATDIKNLINTLPSLDISGIANFKPDLIGVAIKNYADKVTGINWSEVASSTASAKNLRILIASLSGIDTTGVSSFKAAVDELATVNVAGVVAAFSGASEQMASAGTSMINSLVSGMRSGIPSITTLVSDILNYSSSYIRSSTNKFILAGSTLAESIAKGIESKKNKIMTTASSCASDASMVIRGKYSEFVNAGSYLVEGFANGISANTFRAKAQTTAMAEAAIGAAREALKINSPSKVFKAIGSGVPEGFAIGIGMLGGEVKRSVTDMASTAIKSTRSVMSNILEAVSGDVDAQPTIRPVIDLTDVRSGANTIGSLFSDVQAVDVRSNLSAISSSMNSRGQNGTNNDIISAINKLNDGLSSNRGDVYNFGDFTYDDGSNISDAVQTLVRAARVGRRV